MTEDSAEPREDRRQQPKPRAGQSMKAETAAKKLGIYALAAPEEFRAGPVSRATLDALQADPPEWLRTLRAEGPHPRSEVARRLGISNSGLARQGQPDVMTTTEIRTLLEDPPPWLIEERRRAAAARRGEA